MCVILTAAHIDLIKSLLLNILVSRTPKRGQKNLTRPVFSSYSDSDVAIRVIKFLFNE